MIKITHPSISGVVAGLLLVGCGDSQTDLHAGAKGDRSTHEVAIRNTDTGGETPSGEFAAPDESSKLTEAEVLSNRVHDAIEQLSITGKYPNQDEREQLLAGLGALSTAEIEAAVQMANDALEWGKPSVVAHCIVLRFVDGNAEVQSEVVPVLREFIRNRELDGRLKEELVKDASLYAGAHPELAKAILELAYSEEGVSAGTLAACFQAVCATDVSAAVNALAAVEWSPRLEMATTDTYARSALKDPIATSDAVRGLKGRPEYDWAVSGLYQVIRTFDHDRAEIWKAEIVDPRALKAADSKTYMPSE